MMVMQSLRLIVTALQLVLTMPARSLAAMPAAAVAMVTGMIDKVAANIEIFSWLADTSKPSTNDHRRV